MTIKMFYLVAAIVGAVVPTVFYVEHGAEFGFELGAFLSPVVATAVSKGVMADLVIAAVVFWGFMFHRRRLGHGPNPAFYMALTLVIGLGCALPAYLYAMEAGRTRAAS